ncbi:MAG: sugar transferase, partial [Moorella sp. (in: Bacteria)]|nr:sugar transferase [Moorella sp. (in: firmicutes)]
MLLIAVGIRMTSPGPVFYVQERAGLGGKPFKLIKFRTMVDGAEDATGPVLATENDTRVTRIGRILRATRLDELPQFLNVLKGDMSIVGPRPERPFFVNQFREALPAYKHRLRVKPGITGLAQVEGKYDTEPEDKLRYDLYYIRNYSLLLDLQLIIQTLRVMLIPESSRGEKSEGKTTNGWTLDLGTKGLEQGAGREVNRVTASGKALSKDLGGS